MLNYHLLMKCYCKVRPTVVGFSPCHIHKTWNKLKTLLEELQLKIDYGHYRLNSDFDSVIGT